VTDFYLLDEKLTDEERGIRDRLRAFCSDEITPVINGYWERAEFPFALVPKIAALQLGGYLHDNGKVGIADDILLKPGPLTPDEYERACARAAMA